MSQAIEVNSIVEGTVVRLKPFGAIIKLEEDRLGLVHISHVSHKFVQDITEHLNIGDIITAKVLSIDEESGKIALSIKDTLEPEKVSQPENKKNNSDYKSKGGSFDNRNQSSNSPFSLEDKISDWLKLSNERHAGLNKRNKRK